jgi:hypothetical protein
VVSCARTFATPRRAKRPLRPCSRLGRGYRRRARRAYELGARSTAARSSQPGADRCGHDDPGREPAFGWAASGILGRGVHNKLK